MKSTPLVITSVLLFGNCIFNDPQVENVDKGILMSSDRLIEYHSDTITFLEEQQGALQKIVSGTNSIVHDFEYNTTRVAKIPSAIVEGNTVQANDILISGSIAAIAYNDAGDRFSGAIQVIDISKKTKPEINDEWKFSTIDINAVFIDGNTILFGGAADPSVWGFKACIGTFSTGSSSKEQIEESIQPLPSHTVTAITKSGNNYYVSSGAKDGCVIKFDNALHPLDTFDIPDPRDVDAYENGICVLQGTTDNNMANGSLVTLSDELQILNTLKINNFQSDYHKATIEICSGNTVLCGLSSAGSMVMDLKTSTTLFSSPNPPLALPLLSNTNSVSADANLLFSANGNYGFRVFRIKNSNFNQIEIVGYYPFDGLQENGVPYSANHTEFKANYLFVASGSGGVNVYELVLK